MYLKDKKSNDLVEVMDTTELVDPCVSTINGRFHSGEELQDATTFDKSNLIFPSNESLPRCWLDPNYKQPAV